MLRELVWDNVCGRWDAVVDDEKGYQYAVKFILEMEGLKPEDVEFYEDGDTVILHDTLADWDIGLILRRDKRG